MINIFYNSKQNSYYHLKFKYLYFFCGLISLFEFCEASQLVATKKKISRSQQNSSLFDFDIISRENSTQTHVLWLNKNVFKKFLAWLSSLLYCLYIMPYIIINIKKSSLFITHFVISHIMMNHTRCHIWQQQKKNLFCLLHKVSQK